MVKFTWNDVEYECPYAVRNSDSIFLYDENYNLINRILNITKNEWKNIIIQNGEWSNKEDIPTAIDYIRADVDYLMMIIGE